MQEKLLAILAIIMMMIQPSYEDLSFTTKTVVGNLLFEQGTVYALALLMLIITLVL